MVRSGRDADGRAALLAPRRSGTSVGTLRLVGQIAVFNLTGRSTVRRYLSHTVIYYGPRQRTPASGLSALLDGVRPEADPAVSAGHLRLVLRTGSSLPPTLTAATGSTCPSGFTAHATTAASPPSAGGLSAISVGGIPCVK